MTIDGFPFALNSLLAELADKLERRVRTHFPGIENGWLGSPETRQAWGRDFGELSRAVAANCRRLSDLLAAALAATESPAEWQVLLVGNGASYEHNHQNS